MSMSSRLMERGIQLWKSGQKAQAHKIFETIIYNDRGNEAAWIWYIYSLQTHQEKIAGLENFLAVFPGHATAQQALASLRVDVGQRRSQTAALPVRHREPDPFPRVKSAPRPEGHPARKTGSSIFPWMIILLGLCVFLFSFVPLNARYKALQVEHERFVADRQLLSQNLDQLNNDYNSLQGDHRRLSDAYTSLANQYNTLNNEYSILSNTYNSLYAEHNELVQKYNNLAGDYNALNDIAIKPPYIVVHDRMVDTTFYDTDRQLITWTTPFSGLEYGIEHGSYMRSLIVDDEWQTVRVLTADGTPLWIRDFSVFVTPGTFEDVVPPLYQKSSSAYEFIYRIWYMIGQLSSYAVEDTETPRYSLETLLAGGGDCEDLSILFASLIEAAPANWYVDLVYVDSLNLNNPQQPDHVVVYIDTGQETYIVETTSNEYMLPYTDGVTGWLASSLQSGQEELYPVYLR